MRIHHDRVHLVHKKHVIHLRQTSTVRCLSNHIIHMSWGRQRRPGPRNSQALCLEYEVWILAYSVTRRNVGGFEVAWYNTTYLKVYLWHTTYTLFCSTSIHALITGQGFLAAETWFYNIKSQLFSIIYWATCLSTVVGFSVARALGIKQSRSGDHKICNRWIVFRPDCGSTQLAHYVFDGWWFTTEWNTWLYRYDNVYWELVVGSDTICVKLKNTMWPDIQITFNIIYNICGIWHQSFA